MAFSLRLSQEDAPRSTGRRVLLKRPFGARSPSREELAGKPVLLAHRIRPGKTIQLKNSPSKATLPEQQLLHITQPESVAILGSQGPQHCKSGGLLPYSLLGTPQEYEMKLSETNGLPPPPRADEGASQLAAQKVRRP